MSPYFFPDSRRERQRRSILLLSFFAVFFIVIFLRLFFLQIVSGREYRRRAEDNRIKIERQKAPRGLIYDRDGTLLIDNRPTYSAYYNMVKESIPDSCIAVLAGLLEIDTALLQSRIEARQTYTGEAILLKRNVDFHVVSTIEERNVDFPGVSISASPCRHYHYGTLGCHMFGYVGEISEYQLEQRTSGEYTEGDLIGKTGIEAAYEEYLRGRDGYRYVEVNAIGQVIGIIPDLIPKIPVPGDNIYLTIDVELQQFCEEVMAEYRGAIVVLDPRNGDILAMVSHPTFDPNLFATGIDQDTWVRLNMDPSKPLFNRAIQSNYPPASTYKLVTAIAGLEEKAISLFSTMQPCHGYYKFGIRTFRCWKPEGHGLCDVKKGFIQSCDVFFYQLALKLDVDILARYALNLGLGRKTGVDIDSESDGFIPNTDWYNLHYGKDGWTRGVLLNLGIGQGEILVTPLQIACLYAGVVNGGIMVQPHLLNRVESPYDGTTKHIFEPQRSHFVISRGTEQVLIEAMTGVVQDEKGTGNLARVEDVTVGGKTGTAQNPHGEEHAWFVAVAPMEYPQVVISVILENAGHGGEHAAPLAGDILHFWKSRFDAVQKRNYTSHRFPFGRPAIKG
jgi:penicillin-binding protein 2